jgi:hypothetical protein
MSRFSDVVQAIAKKRAQDQAMQLEQAKQQSIKKPGIKDLATTIAALTGGQYLGRELAEGIGSGAGSIVKEGTSGLKDLLSSIGIGGGTTPTAGYEVSKALTTPQLQTIYNTGLETGIPELMPGGIEALAGESSAVPAAGLSGLGTALSLAGIGHGAYGLFDNFGEGDAGSGAMSGAELGAGLGTLIGGPGFGTLIGGGIGALGGGVLGSIHSGQTNPGTLFRNDYRKYLQDKGISPELGYLSLPGGGKFEMTSSGGGKGSYHVDQSGLGGTAVGYLNPLGELTTSGDDKYSGQATGYFSNAALEGATDEPTLMENIRFQYNQAGVGPEEARRGIKRLLNAGRITQQEYAAYENAINKIFT